MASAADVVDLVVKLDNVEVPATAAAKITVANAAEPRGKSLAFAIAPTARRAATSRAGYWRPVPHDLRKRHHPLSLFRRPVASMMRRGRQNSAMLSSSNHRRFRLARLATAIGAVVLHLSACGRPRAGRAAQPAAAARERMPAEFREHLFGNLLTVRVELDGVSG